MKEIGSGNSLSTYLGVGRNDYNRQNNHPTRFERNYDGMEKNSDAWEFDKALNNDISTADQPIKTVDATVGEENEGAGLESLIKVSDTLYNKFVDKDYENILNLPVLDPSAELTEDMVNKAMDQLENKMRTSKFTTQIEKYRATTDDDKQFYSDTLDAINNDIETLKTYRNSGSLEERAEFYNNLVNELETELEYNISLTSEDPVWSAQRLTELRTELKRLPKDLTTFNPNLNILDLSEIDGEGGSRAKNRGDKGLQFDTKDADSVSGGLIHEIGHYYDTENPKWEEFLALSGWQDITSNFELISDDIVADEINPYFGYAMMTRESKPINDNEPIDLEGDEKNVRTLIKDNEFFDLDGDGTDDSVLQVSQGVVYRQDIGANFVDFNGNTDSNGRPFPYSKSNPKEDFAESFKAFFQYPVKLKSEAPEKYNFMVKFTGIDPMASN